MNEKEYESVLDIRPEVALNSEWCEEYARYIELVNADIRRLNGNLHIIERITDFPWRLFGSQRPDEHFWLFTWLSLYESAIMIVWRLCIDTDPRALTLRRLKNEISRNLRPQYKEDFKKLVRTSQFKVSVSEATTRITELRSSWIAHADVAVRLAKNAGYLDTSRLPVRQLLGLRDPIKKLYRVLCLGHVWADHPLGYMSSLEKPSDRDPRTDIEIMLDQIANESHTMNAYRVGGEEWQILKDLFVNDLPIISMYDERLHRFQRWL